jgi:hypothetical protein
MPTFAQSFALLRPSVRPASISGPIQSLLPPTPLSGFSCERGGSEVQTQLKRWNFPMTQTKPHTFPSFSRLSQLAKCCGRPRFFLNRNIFVAQHEIGHVTKN